MKSIKKVRDLYSSENPGMKKVATKKHKRKKSLFNDRPERKKPIHKYLEEE